MNLTRKAVERAWLTTCCSPQPARKSLAKHAYIPGDCPQVILQEIARKIRGETQGLSPSLYGSLYGRENRIAAKKRRSMAYPTLLGDPTRACRLLRLHRPSRPSLTVTNRAGTTYEYKFPDCPSSLWLGLVLPGGTEYQRTQRETENHRATLSVSLARYNRSMLQTT